MRALTADFFVSVDGFSSDAAGTQDWIHPFFGPEMMRFIQGVLATPQELVIGRKTYEVLFGYWPGAKEPGESGHGSPSRRKTLPPGVPADWGTPDA